MNFLQMPRMIFSFSEGWNELIRIHPSIARLFGSMVLPLSLLPPAMIYYAGWSHGDALVPGLTSAQWHAAAEIIFLAEMVTVPILAWLIHLVARLNDVAAGDHACLTLAAIAPVPLWLSSLALFVPNLFFGVVAGGIGLVCSVGLLYRGVYALFSMHEDIKALQMALVIAGAGLLMWLVLIQVVLVY